MLQFLCQVFGALSLLSASSRLLSSDSSIEMVLGTIGAAIGVAGVVLLANTAKSNVVNSEVFLRIKSRISK